VRVFGYRRITKLSGVDIALRTLSGLPLLSLSFKVPASSFRSATVEILCRGDLAIFHSI
jgi:hypothetical protein